MSALDPSTIDDELAMRRLEAELLDALGPLRGPTIRERLGARVVHTLRGCRSQPLCAFDLTGGRLVQVGWLCPRCGRESDSARGGHR